MPRFWYSDSKRENEDKQVNSIKIRTQVIIQNTSRQHQNQEERQHSEHATETSVRTLQKGWYSPWYNQQGDYLT